MYEEAFEPSDARVWSGALHFNPEIKKEIDNKRLPFSIVLFRKC